MLSYQYLYIYVVDRDLGFAPNPFHGYCTLATCKPGIRKSAQIGDWVMGVGGGRLKATGKIIFLMRISEVINFESYWTDPRFQIKKPIRNGSSVMMVGDNIYHFDKVAGTWVQEDSHHSNGDGSTNKINYDRDTKSDNVLISTHFFYFGSAAPAQDLKLIGYKNGRGYSKKQLNNVLVTTLINDLENQYWRDRNLVIADPIQFDLAEKRVDQNSGKIS